MFTKRKLALAAIASLVMFNGCSEDAKEEAQTIINDAVKTKAELVAHAEANNVFGVSTGVSATNLMPTSNTDKGALAGGSDWTKGWTKFAGYTPANIAAAPTDTLTDKISGDVTLDASKVYLLKGFVYVTGSLTIPAGTTIKGAEGTGESASALIVAQGGTINVNGTATKPVVMTSVKDNGTLSSTTRGLWGGLIVLGSAPINRKAGYNQIEGIPDDVAYGRYGGTNAEEGTSSIKYLSIRYGGSLIGADNEINGLTLGGVGTGTKVSYVEVYNNKDDGFEFFGGTVNTDHLLSVGCADDSYDWDEGFVGTNSNWIAIQTDAGDKLAEMDGSAKDNFGNSTPSNPTVSKSTFVGKAGGASLKFREETKGTYADCIFVNTSKVTVDREKGFFGADANLVGNVFDAAWSESFIDYVEPAAK